MYTHVSKDGVLYRRANTSEGEWLATVGGSIYPLNCYGELPEGDIFSDQFDINSEEHSLACTSSENIFEIYHDTLLGKLEYLFSFKKRISFSDLSDVIKIQNYNSFMVCSGQYDDAEDRKKGEEWRNEIRKIRSNLNPEVKHLLNVHWRDLNKRVIVTGVCNCG